MSLHNQIMELPTQDRHLEDWSNTRMAWLAGFDTGLHEAAQLAKEADELMAEMADVIKAFHIWANEQGKKEAASLIDGVLNDYYKWKEQAK